MDDSKLAAWVGLADSEWMNIVNHDHAYRAYSKDGAVLLAIKMTEAKLKELNTAPIPAADHQKVTDEQDIDLEAIAWAYQKLLAYGVGNASGNALMLDRLNLMLMGGE